MPKILSVLTSVSLATGLLSVVAGSAQAALLIGNIAGVPSSLNFSTTSITAAGSGNNDQRKAVEFTTGGTAQTLTSVQLYLAGYDTADTPVITIFQGTANASVAGTTVTLLAPPNPAPLPNTDPQAGVNTVYEYTAFSPASYTFLPNTQYTLIVAADAGAFNWLRDSLSNVTPTGLATFDRYLFSELGNPFFEDSVLFNNFAINTAPVVPTPEPATVLGLLTVGLLGTVSSSYRKKAENQK
ncbi:choice-of-anchor R domain-containing protein [Pannus brasiliensis CCIBt3594]|uniref:Choice-of-anchor R domain-containing protein n=1 Tax=Pannus brasiliensis CCIBt3594 TaxID=1427578 RepID=A0AAW9QUQ9_9CHRO